MGVALELSAILFVLVRNSKRQEVNLPLGGASGLQLYCVRDIKTQEGDADREEGPHGIDAESQTCMLGCTQLLPFIQRRVQFGKHCLFLS